MYLSTSSCITPSKPKSSMKAPYLFMLLGRYTVCWFSRHHFSKCAISSSSRPQNAGSSMGKEKREGASVLRISYRASGVPRSTAALQGFRSSEEGGSRQETRRKRRKKNLLE